MYQQIGSILLYLSLLIAWILFFIHWKKEVKEKLYKNVKQLTLISCLFLWIPMFMLIFAFISKDYSLIVVFENVDNSMSTFDRIMATWAARPGSMLLWGVLQSTITVFCLYYLEKPFENKTEKRIITIVLFFNALISTFALSVRDPTAFDTRTIDPSADPWGLTPSLMNFWQQIHPPVAFLSYSAFIVPYAIGLAGLMKEKQDVLSERVRWLSDFFMMIGWVLTTIFIIAGSIWSYEVDWGGFWFFDPVQTSSLILWVMASLYFHFKPLMNKDYPIHQLMASLGWVGVAFAAFIVRGGLLEGPHQYTGTAQLIVFSLLLLGTVLGLIYSLRNCKEEVIPDWLFSLDKASNKVSLLTVWALVLIIIINLTSLVLQIIYYQLDFFLGDLTTYYRIINGTLFTILGLLLIICEIDAIKPTKNTVSILVSLGMGSIFLWSIFFLPEFRIYSFILLLLMGTFVLIQLGHVIIVLSRKNKIRKIGLRLTHFVILLTLFSYVVTDPQTSEITTPISLNSPVIINDFDLKITMTDILSGVPSKVDILVQNLDNTTVGTVHLTQGIYQRSPWSKGDWIIQHSSDIFIKLSEINEFLFFVDLITVSITIKIIPGVNIFRANILLFTLVGLFGIWIKWNSRPKITI